MATSMMVIERTVIMGLENLSMPFFTPPKLAIAVMTRNMMVYTSGSHVELMNPPKAPE